MVGQQQRYEHLYLQLNPLMMSVHQVQEDQSASMVALHTQHQQKKSHGYN
jgi:hypothetical protein